MNRTILAVFFYGVILILGGLTGYFHSGSMISLITGVIFGILIILCSGLMLAKKPYVEYVTLGITLMLTVVFAIRFSKTHAFYMIALTLFSGYLSFLVLLKIFHLNRHD